MATLAELERALVNAHTAGDTDAATALAREIVRVRGSAKGAEWKPSEPTEGMSGSEKFLAGAGKAFMDIGRGAGQWVGLVDRKDVDEAKRLDKPLMETGAGIAGNIVGNLAAAAPTVLIPSAATVPGAALVGAGLGALEPTGTQGSTVANILTGGMMGAAIPAVITGYKGLRAAADSFSKAGRERIVGRTIERFMDDPKSLAAARGEIVPGSSPTLAESTLDPGLATLQRSAVSADPVLASAIDNRRLEQNAARVAALRQIGGDAGQLEFHEAARSATAKELYDRAFKETPENTKWIKGQLTNLMKRPAFVDALKEAQSIAANEGLPLRVFQKEAGIQFDPKDSTRILHYAKKALVDKISASEGNAQSAYIATRDKLVSLMESKDFSPSYREARDTFKQMSGPINRMEVGKEIERRAFSPLEDKLGNPTLTPGKFGQAVKGSEDIVQKATGRRQAFEDVLTPEQNEIINKIRQDLARQQSAEKLGKATGSPTAQYLSSQNLMQQMAGPLGMPRSWAQSALMQTAMRPVDFATKRAEPLLQEVLSQAILDPMEARRIMEALARSNGGLLSDSARYVVPPLSGLLALSGNPLQ